MYQNKLIAVRQCQIQYHTYHASDACFFFCARSSFSKLLERKVIIKRNYIYQRDQYPTQELPNNSTHYSSFPRSTSLALPSPPAQSPPRPDTRSRASPCLPWGSWRSCRRTGWSERELRQVHRSSSAAPRTPVLGRTSPTGGIAEAGRSWHTAEKYRLRAGAASPEDGPGSAG